MRRRAAMMGGGATIASMAAGRAHAAPEEPGFTAPDLACDAHQHIIGDPQAYPMVGTRSYTPPQAPLSELQALHRALKIRRAVLVQPSFYGTDNSCLLDSLKTLGTAGRGIAVIGPNTPDADLDAMGRLGVRGVRVNQTGGSKDPAVLAQSIVRMASKIGARGWHVQTFLPLQTIASLQDVFAGLPTPIVFDHFGGARASGTEQLGFDVLCKLLASGNCYVKLSAPYHESTLAPGYADMASLARTLVEARPDRVLWGSDWPHTNSNLAPGRTATDISPFYAVNDGTLFDQVPVWMRDAGVRKQVLVDTPARLFDF